MHQKEIFRIMLYALLVGLWWAPMGSAQIAGQWEVKLMMGEQPSYHDLVIQEKPDGSLTATYNGSPLEKVKFENDKLTFVRRLEFGGNEMASDFSATLANGKLSGAMHADQWDADFTATKAVPLSPALGIWDISFAVMDRDITAQLKITTQEDGSLAGQWAEEMGEHTISKLMCQDGKLTFTRHSTINDMEFDTNYVGTISGNALTGKLSGDMGEWQANGKRAHGDFIGQWTLETDSEWGPPTRRLVILPDLRVRYQFFDGLNPLSKVKIDGNKLTAVIEMGWGGQTVEMNFEATLTEGQLKGVIHSDRGDTTFTGKKVTPTVPAVKVQKP